MHRALLTLPSLSACTENARNLKVVPKWLLWECLQGAPQRARGDCHPGVHPAWTKTHSGPLVAWSWRDLRRRLPMPNKGRSNKKAAAPAAAPAPAAAAHDPKKTWKVERLTGARAQKGTLSNGTPRYTCVRRFDFLRQRLRARVSLRVRPSPASLSPNWAFREMSEYLYHDQLCECLMCCVLSV